MLRLVHIYLHTPAPRASRRGNRITANRWSGILKSLGHRVTVNHQYHGQRADVLVALHARKSASVVRQVHERAPETKIIVAMTGTDLYQDLGTSRITQQSVHLADRVVVLQPDAIRYLPEAARQKARPILQSASAPDKLPERSPKHFDVCVIGHLRDVKDPFRTAMAVRKLPDDSRIRVRHAGAALTKAMLERAERENAGNARYHWLRELTPNGAQRLMAKSHLLVISSESEGGANVISEALAVDTPVLSSRISGSIGILGEDYPGYFEYGRTDELRDLLLRCEQDLDGIYRSLRAWCRERRSLLCPEGEMQAWKKLLAEFS